jgi:hypothetical protein
MEATKFETEIYHSTLNVDSISFKSPKTGEWIEIYKGWFGEIPDELATKVFGAWWAYCELCRDNWSKNHKSREHWFRENKCTVGLTVAELTTLFNIYKDQQEKRMKWRS